MNQSFLKSTASAAVFSLLLFVSATAQDNSIGSTTTTTTTDNLVREDDFAPAETTQAPIADAGQVILTTYNSEEILVVVQDIFGNELYSKIIFVNQCAVLKAYDPYNTIPSGVYTVVATTRNELYNQKIVID